MALHESASCATCQRRDTLYAVAKPFYPRVTGRKGNTVAFDGTPRLLAGGNDYLDLSTDPRVKEAAKEAVDEFGVGLTGSPLMNGHLALHEELAARLADWVGKEAAMLFTAGYLANLGGVSELCQMNPLGTVVIRDESVHASLIDGIRLGGPRSWSFRHNDMDSLRSQLVRAGQRTKKILIVIDGVYSVQGDIAPLPDIVELARRYGAEIFLDDAHGFGVVGEGRGTAAMYGLTDEIDYVSATFSKAGGGSGGFLATSRDVVDHLGARCSPHMFAAALPPAMTAAMLASLRIMGEEPQRAQRVLAVADTLRAALTGLGYTAGGQTPIIPVAMRGMFGSADDADVLALTHDEKTTLARLRRDLLDQKDTAGTFRAQQWLLDHGVYVNPFVPPGSVDPLLRISVTSGYTADDVRVVIDAFDGLRQTIPALNGSPAMLANRS